MDAVRMAAAALLKTAQLTEQDCSSGCLRFLVTAGEAAPQEKDACFTLSLGGPKLLAAAFADVEDADFAELEARAEEAAQRSAELARAVGEYLSAALGLRFAGVLAEMAAIPSASDSVIEILQQMGLEDCGAQGTIAALLMLNGAICRGAAKAGAIGGRGLLLPVSRDIGLINSALGSAFDWGRLEALSGLSGGPQYIAVGGDTGCGKLTGLLADELALALAAKREAELRIIVARGFLSGDVVDFGDENGIAPVLALSELNNAPFARRHGRIGGK
jgi:uncharacterized protein (UPF0210 family)